MLRPIYHYVMPYILTLRPICPYVAPYNLQYDYKFISSGGCTSVLPDGGSLRVGVPLFVLSSAVLPNVSVFAFSLSVLVLSVPVFVFSAFFIVLSIYTVDFIAFHSHVFCSKRSENVPPFPAISLRRASNASFVLI